MRRPVESRSPEVYSCSPVHEHRTAGHRRRPLCTVPSSVLSLGEPRLPLLFLLGAGTPDAGASPPHPPRIRRGRPHYSTAQPRAAIVLARANLAHAH